jgi:hypothetical protein
MATELRSLVRERAGGRCEYCRFPDNELPWSPYHVDHLVARQHGGGDELENLVWACARCNSRKGTNLSGVDPDSSEVVRIFNPRIQKWNEHFGLSGHTIEGRTPTGRTSVWLLDMNFEPRLLLRAQLISVGKW